MELYERTDMESRKITFSADLAGRKAISPIKAAAIIANGAKIHRIAVYHDHGIHARLAAKALNTD